MSKKKIVIIGAGNMGGAIAASLRGTDYEVTVTAHTRQTLSRIHSLCPDFHVTLDNVQAVTNADIIVLAVKPYLLAEVAHEIRNHIKRGATIISVVAAVSIDELKEMLGNHDVFRVIPNTAIRLGKSATFIAGKSEGNSIKEVEAIFNRSGKSFLIEEK
ncbi:MAG: NAD(P)-binding domain-containing protein, partial [Muribaculaceae bacterium]|nr:NAD(P)-binding domain-containing protein [Muribaculaceae bacterium]